MSTPPPLLRSRVSSFVATSIATAASFSAVSTILSAVSEGIQAAATAEGQGVTPGLELALRDEMNVEPENYEDCPAATQMHLSTTCDSCGERVTLEVPLWLTEGLSGANSRGQSEGEARSEWRSGVVSTAVAVAVAIKESPIPNLLVAMMKWLFLCGLYLDARFSLHQRVGILLGALLETLMEVEKEVSLFKNIGETCSVLWEASIKSTLAFAKTDSTTTPYVEEPETTNYTKRTSSTKAHSSPPSLRRPPPPGQFISPKSTTAHSRSHSNTAHSPHRTKGKNSDVSSRYDSKPFLAPLSAGPTLRRTSRSTSSLKSPKIPTVPFPSSSSTPNEPPSYSAIVTPPSAHGEARRRSRSATGGTTDNEGQEEEERERELLRLRERIISTNSWAGRALAVGRNLSGRVSH